MSDVDGLAPAPGLGLVEDVVVDQRAKVQQFEGVGQNSQGSIRGPVRTDGAAHQMHAAPPDLLAASSQVRGGALEPRPGSLDADVDLISQHGHSLLSVQ